MFYKSVGGQSSSANGDLARTQDDFNFYIILMQIEGKLLRCINNESKQTSKLLHNITALALSRNRRNILIVSQSIGCVGMTLAGDFTYRYREQGEHFHTGLCSDKKGNMYVQAINKGHLVKFRLFTFEIQKFKVK